MYLYNLIRAWKTCIRYETNQHNLGDIWYIYICMVTILTQNCIVFLFISDLIAKLERRRSMHHVLVRVLVHNLYERMTFLVSTHVRDAVSESYKHFILAWSSLLQLCAQFLHTTLIYILNFPLVASYDIHGKGDYVILSIHHKALEYSV